MIKDIQGYEGLYAVDETGQVMSLLHTSSRRRRALKPYVNTGGYLRVNLFKDGKTEHKYIHRLVADAFLPNPDRLEVVNHIDADPTNNNLFNLEWCSQKQNIKHSQTLGNQNDIPVSAFSIISGVTHKYPNLKTAGESLFGKWWALRYHYRTKGKVFSLGEWDIRCE